MKTKKYLFLMFLAFVSVAFIACETEDAETCDGEDIAEDFCPNLDISIIATFCTDGVNKSYYTYSGENYYCDGVDANTCNTALQNIGKQIIIDHPDCITKKSGGVNLVYIKLNKMAENLLTEVRNKSLCK